MTKTDKEYLDSRFHGLSKLMDAQFENVHDSLDAIKEQNKIRNGRLEKVEDHYNELDKIVNKGLPHTIALCPQGPVLEEMKNDITKIKEGKVAERTIKEHIRANISVILVGFGILVTITMNLMNYERNGKQIVTQDDIKQTQLEIKTEILKQLRADSTLIFK
jgi:hypothetical protein